MPQVLRAHPQRFWPCCLQWHPRGAAACGRAACSGTSVAQPRLAMLPAVAFWPPWRHCFGRAARGCSRVVAGQAYLAGRQLSAHRQFFCTPAVSCTLAVVCTQAAFLHYGSISCSRKRWWQFLLAVVQCTCWQRCRACAGSGAVHMLAIMHCTCWRLCSAPAGDYAEHLLAVVQCTCWQLCSAPAGSCMCRHWCSARAGGCTEAVHVTNRALRGSIMI